MKIEFFLSSEDCNKILEANGYVVEEVSVKFNLWDNFYSHGSIKDYDNDFVIHKEIVAYRVGNRPKEFENQPLEKLECSYKYSDVIEKLAKEKFIQLMCS